MGGQYRNSSSLVGRLALILLALCTLAVAGCGKRIVHSPAYQSGYAKQGVGPRNDGEAGPKVTDPKTSPYTVLGKTYHPLATSSGYNEVGVASWYGEDFHGKLTATGEVYDMYGVSAAHKTLPLGSRVKVTNLRNGQSVRLVINDRGPFVGDRIIDLSYGAAKSLGMVEQGLAKVRIRALAPARGSRTASADSGPYFIQVGAFAEAPNAKRLHNKLVRAGYSGSRIKSLRRDGRTLMGVQAGAFTSLPRAKRALSRLRAHFPSCYIASR